ncbi:hypothetical protein [Williamsia sp. 1135]|uniref:hypothetical protein n=1 Tax=Williamsia sp. 1135 TaxID=1889262 RepID=UPI00117FF1B8|nr:hypothetical protein [Williamsia sp. 1135]
MRTMKMCGALAAAAALVLAGCSSESTTDAETTGTTATSTATAGECRDMVPFSEGGREDKGQGPAAQAVAESVALPGGVSLVTGRRSTDSDHPGEFAIAIDLCGGDITTTDELRPVATAFAMAYKAAPVSEQVFALYVAHYASFTETDTTGEIKLKDSDFQAHLWNGKPSESAELARWEVVTG